MRTHRADLKAFLDEYLESRFDIDTGNVFGYPAYKRLDRLFLIIGREGIALLLPSRRVSALLKHDPVYSPFQPLKGIIWDQWVQIIRDSEEAYRVDLPLIDESINFVSVRA